LGQDIATWSQQSSSAGHQWTGTSVALDRPVSHWHPRRFITGPLTRTQSSKKSGEGKRYWHRVFGRKATIAIPDSELLRPDDLQPLNLAQVLPDWSSDDQLRLLSRPVFDPATFGRARLHNDNEEGCPRIRRSAMAPSFARGQSVTQRLIRERSLQIA
jgi:hypothetical protein